jgi:hypothetical protein
MTLEENQLKKHAYLITAYDNQYQLEQLLSLLNDERNDIYLQVDSKGSLRVDNLILNKSSLFILPPVPINWAAFSFIQAELNLLKAATERRYHYYHFLSGSDLPLVNQDIIHNFLENSDLEYVDFAPGGLLRGHWKAAYYHFFVDTKFYREYLFVRILSHLLIKLQILFGIDRSKTFHETFYSGSTWFTITHSFAEYILAHQAWIEKTFLYGLACDEVFIQTLLMKSPFKSKMNNGLDGTTQNLRYIDWKRRDKNSPYTFQMSDYEELKEASKHSLFARKFNRTTDQGLVDSIVDRIMNHGSL